MGQREGLLQAQLLAAAVEAVGAVDAFGVVVAAGAILHGPQLLGALHRQDTWTCHLGVLPTLETQCPPRTEPVLLNSFPI